ncbi:4945_t:CDS:1, partial [Acaulospora colombiana]
MNLLGEFIQPETLDHEEMNIHEKRSTVRRRGQGGRFAKTTKLRYTKVPSFKTMISSYFDPSEEAERFHVGIGKK